MVSCVRFQNRVGRPCASTEKDVASAPGSGWQLLAWQPRSQENTSSLASMAFPREQRVALHGDQNLTLTPPYTVNGAAGVIVCGFSRTVALRPTPTGSPATLRKDPASK